MSEKISFRAIYALCQVLCHRAAHKFCCKYWQILGKMAAKEGFFGQPCVKKSERQLSAQGKNQVEQQ
jgi:hypothetical protein